MSAFFKESSSLVVLLTLMFVSGTAAWLLLILTKKIQPDKKVSGKAKPGRKKSFSLTLTLFNTSLFLIIICFLLLFVISGMYTSFTREELVAVVTCEKADNDSTDFFLTITPVEYNLKQTPQKFAIRGEQWSLSGHIVKWDNWMNALGLVSMYKLTRIEGRYIETIQQATEQITVYPLVTENNKLWIWFYKNGHKLPFVSAVFGNSVYTFPSFTDSFNVYVTTSGFVVRMKNQEIPLSGDEPKREL